MIRRPDEAATAAIRVALGRGAAILAVAILVAGVAGPAGAAPPAGGYWVGQLRLPAAWALSQGAGVTVGVLDTGVNGGLPALAGAVLPGRSFPDLGNGVQDARGHGTAVALLIAGRPGSGGVAPRATILPAIAAAGGASADEAIRWLVDRHVGVINLSAGRPGTGGDRATTELDGALAYAAAHDVVVVAAAGNSSQDRGVVSPANRPAVIAVSAVDSTGAFRPDVSVSGPEVALAAPGVGMTAVARARVAGQPLSADGTSWSAAVVSGVVALVRARHPGLNAVQVARLIQATARPAGPPGRDPEYGFGVVDPVAALSAPPPSSPAAASAPAPAPRAAVLTAVSVGAALLLVPVYSLVRRRRSHRT
ncbi:S8 family serine peptidase [Paractinoplanes globisporus]|uniref:S8 family serine peptidase n=1 Tax=Paractinoplanes globisporus TaxID=113565 RepID=A0ABW6WYA8_9ACTN|nr:S8 family serine peptidase [Actinoplanes globisporus]